MGRRKRGRVIDGWLLIDKPAGMGSTDVVSAARRALDARKAGHAGTLDPGATGLLAIAFGEATKTVPFAMDGRKTYRFTVRWGQATDSDDADGVVTEERAARPDRAAIEAALPAFRGEIMQRPPGVSAIKVAGRRAYDIAREEGAPDLPPRPILVSRLELIDILDDDHALFEMDCGKGGYVRAVARDLGVALGCLGHVTMLRRLAAGPFSIDQAISFETLRDLSDRSAPEKVLLPVAAGLDDIPALPIDSEAAARIRQGQAAPVSGAAATVSFVNGEPIWAHHDGRPVGLGVFEAGQFKPTRVFNWTTEEDSDVDHNRS